MTVARLVGLCRYRIRAKLCEGEPIPRVAWRNVGCLVWAASLLLCLLERVIYLASVMCGVPILKGFVKELHHACYRYGWTR
jgi:hypothetical protein